MIHIKNSNAIDVWLASENSVLFHKVNTRGVMGSGIAKEIRERVPQHYEDYRIHLDYRNGECLGNFVESSDDVHGRSVVGLYGQSEYGRGGKFTNYAALASALIYFLGNYRENKTTFIIPKFIGCGLGGGDWSIVEALLLDMEELYGIEFVCVER
jgi:O-acetyl-ADP-ribose deacetylase (regulator of RNase III)